MPLSNNLMADSYKLSWSVVVKHYWHKSIQSSIHRCDLKCLRIVQVCIRAPLFLLALLVRNVTNCPRASTVVKYVFWIFGYCNSSVVGRIRPIRKIGELLNPMVQNVMVISPADIRHPTFYIFLPLRDHNMKIKTSFHAGLLRVIIVKNTAGL